MEDYLYKLLSIYNNLPIPLKKILGKLYNVIPRTIRFGNFYSIYNKRITDFNSRNKIGDQLEMQKEILFAHVNEAIQSVKYYQNYEKCFSLDDFRKYPIINKKIINGNFSDFLNPKYSNRRIKTNTGGSSGNPMEFFLEQNVSRAKEKAHFDWYWGQFDYRPNDKILMIRGLPLKNNRTFEYNMIDNVLMVSCYNVNESNILGILKEINFFKPRFIHAYPSSLKIITSLLELHLEKVKLNITAIFLGSEHLVDIDRSYFEKFYQSKVINWYGHTERLIHGGNCPYSHDFHFYPFYGYIELLDDNNHQITEANKVGRIVATGFDNKVMPLIRYDTGDLGELSEHKSCKCGFKGLSIRKINGRGQDFIILSDKTKVSVTAFIYGQHLEAFKNIMDMQVIQNRIGEMEINIVKCPGFSARDEKSLIDTLLKSIDYKLKIKINLVSFIPKTPRGKNIFFISNIT